MYSVLISSSNVSVPCSFWVLFFSFRSTVWTLQVHRVHHISPMSLTSSPCLSVPPCSSHLSSLPFFNIRRMCLHLFVSFFVHFLQIVLILAHVSQEFVHVFFLKSSLASLLICTLHLQHVFLFHTWGILYTSQRLFKPCFPQTTLNTSMN